MEESFSIPPEECGDSELDPRIQLELEKLNTATAEINKLELELDESNTTFRMLLNEATRRLKGLAARLGNSVDRARPYHEAANAAASARAACQRAAVQYQRASEIHAAAKETVALAEQRFKSNQHEQWQFDNAWQEMLNHATIKVMDAENQKAESGREHMKRAQLFNAAETKLQRMEEQQRKHIAKSRPYFEEKQLCQEQLATQKLRIEQLHGEVGRAKACYARALRALEDISEEIHRKRRNLYGDSEECPVGPREPGVGAERDVDYSLELERHEQDIRHPECATPEEECGAAGGLEELRRRVRRLAARPLEAGGSHGDSSWEEELNSTVQRLDQMLLARELEARNREKRMLTASQSAHSSRDKLSDSHPAAVVRSHSSHNPSQLLHGYSDIALSQDQASDHPAPTPAQNALSQKSELFFSQPDISSSHTLFPKLSHLSTNPPDSFSSQSSYDNSLDVNCEPSLDSLENYATDNAKDIKVSLKEMSTLQLCLSVSTLEDLLPAGSKDLPIIKSISKTAKDSSDDAKYVPFSYKVTFDDFQPSPSKSNQGQNILSDNSSSENEKPFRNLQGSNQSLEAVSDVASEDGSGIKSPEIDPVSPAVPQPEVEVSEQDRVAVEVGVAGAQEDKV